MPVLTPIPAILTRTQIYQNIPRVCAWAVRLKGRSVSLPPSKPWWRGRLRWPWWIVSGRWTSGGVLCSKTTSMCVSSRGNTTISSNTIHSTVEKWWASRQNLTFSTFFKPEGYESLIPDHLLLEFCDRILSYNEYSQIIRRYQWCSYWLLAVLSLPQATSCVSQQSSLRWLLVVHTPPLPPPGLLWIPADIIAPHASSCQSGLWTCPPYFANSYMRWCSILNRYFWSVVVRVSWGVCILPRRYLPNGCR